MPYVDTGDGKKHLSTWIISEHTEEINESFFQVSKSSEL